MSTPDIQTVDLYDDDETTPFATNVPLDQAFGDDCPEECKAASRALASGHEFVTGGGAAPLIRIRAAR